MRFIIYNQSGTILRSGSCSALDFFKQAGDGEFVIEGKADDITQKIINGKVVDKTHEEISADKPRPIEIPMEKRLAPIDNEQWQDVLDRLKKLESEILKPTTPA